MRHHASHPGLELASMNACHCFGEQILHFLCRFWHPQQFRSDRQWIASVFSPTQFPQLSRPLWICVKCAETALYCHGFTTLAQFGFSSTVLPHAPLLRPAPSDDLTSLVSSLLGSRFGRKTGKPSFPILRAQPLPANRFGFPTPLRNINPRNRLLEAIAMQGTLSP